MVREELRTMAYDHICGDQSAACDMECASREFTVEETFDCGLSIVEQADDERFTARCYEVADEIGRY